MVISADGSFDDFSLLAGLTTGSGCAFGNQLDANFKIPAASLSSSNVAATGLDPPHPLDLLEDDGTTGIQANITRYSCDGCVTTAVPEPSLAPLAGGILALLGLVKKQVFLRRKT